MPEQPQPATTAEQPQAAGITADQASLLLKADVRNLSKKLREGKSLTPSERGMLRSIASGGTGATETFVRSQVELANVLGISRKTIERARRRPGNPGVRDDGRLDVAAWRDYLKETTTCFEKDNDPQSSKQAAQARNLLLKNEKLEADIAILRREWLPVADIEKLGGDLGAAIRKVVTTLHLVAPTVVGMTVAEAEERLRDLENEVLGQLGMIQEEITKRKGARDESSP